jgi:hypothetical protein
MKRRKTNSWLKAQLKFAEFRVEPSIHGQCISWVIDIIRGEAAYIGEHSVDSLPDHSLVSTLFWTLVDAKFI